MEIAKNSKLELICEGKTKRIFSLDSNSVLIVSKDRITAGDGVKSHELKGKSVISTQTNCALFEFLSAAGVPNAFVSRVADTHPEWERAFVAHKCSMIPIEWVCRRLATGSYLKRNPNVQQGMRFTPLKLETFFKDDANHDPQWSDDSIIGAQLRIGGLLINEKHVQQMHSMTRLVFELLERVWQTMDHTLVDMKIEFGVNQHNQIIVSDVIDNDSWRLWPMGDKRQQLDKQMYRELTSVSEDDLNTIKDKFQIVAHRTRQLFKSVVDDNNYSVAIVLGSLSDMSHVDKIKTTLNGLGIDSVIVEVTSAHKSTKKTLEVVSKLNANPKIKAIIAVAGLSNGLGPVIAGNSSIPVINNPPLNEHNVAMDLWSSLRMPSGMGCSTVLGGENAALHAAMIVGNQSPIIWSKIKTKQTLNEIKLIHS